MHLSSILIILLVLTVVAVFFGFREYKRVLGLYKHSLKMRSDLETDLRREITFLKEGYEKAIATLYKTIETESKEKEEYHKRVIEIENGIKESVGITLRNDITQVNVQFDEIELYQMAEGVKLLIQKLYANISDVEYLVKLTKKLQEATGSVIKSKSEKDIPVI
jgi:hypothetical protein